MSLPRLVVVSGPTGAGKTSLAHKLALAIGCPAICRDEIKEGMTLTYAGYEPQDSDPLALQTYRAFFDVVELLLRAEVTLVAEAAFQGMRWHPHLERFSSLADIKVIRCQVDLATAHARAIVRDEASAIRQRSDTKANAAFSDGWQGITMDLPTLVVKTDDGYDPGLDAIVAFSRQR